MGFRFRKSVNLGPLRLNFSKSGIGYSIGGKGFRLTKRADGREQATASIPGTGISYTTTAKSSSATTAKGDSAKQPRKSGKKPKRKWIIAVAVIAALYILGSGGKSDEVPAPENNPEPQAQTEVQDDAAKETPQEEEPTSEAPEKTPDPVEDPAETKPEPQAETPQETPQAQQPAKSETPAEAPAAAPAATPAADPAPAQGNARTVYVTKSGKRYHYDSSCNGGTYYPSTLAEAQSRGLTPCKKCVG